VPEVLICFERPASLSESEMRSWVMERAQTRRPMVALDGSGPVLRVDIAAEAADDQLADLMLDMRLLGLRPTVVGPS
jgi:hypothetical protein